LKKKQQPKAFIKQEIMSFDGDEGNEIFDELIFHTVHGGDTSIDVNNSVEGFNKALSLANGSIKIAFDDRR